MYRSALSRLSNGVASRRHLPAALRPAFTRGMADVDDKSLEGRYANALFQAASRKKILDKVFGDLEQIRDSIAESKEFKLFVETPGIPTDIKGTVFGSIAQKYQFQDVTVNFLKVLMENRRVGMLQKVIDVFEDFFRAHKGEVKCKVTSAKPLSAAESKEIEAALKKRAGKDAKLIMEWNTSPAIMGGLVVKLGDQVLDFSVQSKIERLQSQLMNPV
ncbi:unnamed protein product [Vitrella brassicaformis CCMP3155]|uniref:ATP synthase subunit O, mitochondrial n=2 Tax=Vitrella brassicaformis TaxID=1169539 RepID=A0A0G4GFR5_VITBC|nr:unnamed protein product [Vitrella brassicaformis CCMP3155]|mmetsp:Transcript_46604/g.116095  ORF Transcript_46604/g.116095 Transcript_46604/m.116095 type:complete len:217 (+) Transcript_46604:57-707(+)|eukprot:CEM28148.1 unnamed protein product [Vitrella brassicaformis CCMP3155]